jgi:uncharacterized membrane protein YeaQ/YmgE (transglycosylase-associated protein family)
MQFLLWIIIGSIAGWLTGKIMKGYGHGKEMDILMGVTGAVAGGFTMYAAGFSGQGRMAYTILVAILGAIVLTASIAVASGRRRYV